MKVAILSMQKVVNYGSFLQAYALKKTVENYGYETEFIDIEPGIKILKSNPKLDKLRRLISKNPLHTIKQQRQKKKFYNIYKEELNKYLNIEVDKNYDITDSKALVIGSDEVFNCTTESPWGFSEQLFGKDFSIPVISYAASFGDTTIKKLRDYKIYKLVKKNLQKLKFVSVRDNNSKGIVDDMKINNSVISLDPTLIYDFSDEIIEQNDFQDYIIIYAYPYRFSNKEEITKIKQFAKVRNLKTIAVGFYQYWCDYNIVVKPFEFLSFMKNASYIITDTFHGTVFSIKYNKPFCTFVRESNSQKIQSLLQQFDLESRIVNENYDIEEVFKKNINYAHVNSKINEFAKESKEYIRISLEKCVNYEKK